jgi:DNA-binding CsgD family transcriptional regulator
MKSKERTRSHLNHEGDERMADENLLMDRGRDPFGPGACRRGDALNRPLQASPKHDLALREHVDRLLYGIVVCDAEAQVHWLNRSAERLLAQGPLRLVGSRLLADSPAAMQALMQKLAEAAATGGRTVHYLGLGEGKLALHVGVQAAAKSSSIALTLTSPRQSTALPVGALIQLFGLTPTEASLVAALASGSSVAQYAQQGGVSVQTARKHLKHALEKTGTRRQSELVRLVCTSVAAHVSVK